LLSSVIIKFYYFSLNPEKKKVVSMFSPVHVTRLGLLSVVAELSQLFPTQVKVLFLRDSSFEVYITKSFNAQSVTQWVCDLCFVDKSWRCSLVQIKTIINVFLVHYQCAKSDGCGLAIGPGKYVYKKNNTNSNKIRVILCMTILKKKMHIYILYKSYLLFYMNLQLINLYIIHLDTS